MRHASSPARKLHYSLINTLPKYLSHTQMCWCEKICALIPSLGDLFENHLHAEPCRAAREEQRMVAPDDPQPPPAGFLLPVCSAHGFCTFCLLILLIQKLVCSPETSQMVQEGFRLNNERGICPGKWAPQCRQTMPILALCGDLLIFWRDVTFTDEIAAFKRWIKLSKLNYLTIKENF